MLVLVLLYEKRHAHTYTYTYTYLHTVEGLSLNYYIPSPGPLWFVGWLCLLSLTYAYTNDNNDDDDDKASNDGMNVTNKAFYTPFYLVISALVLSG